MNNKELINRFRLPVYTSGKSFADASKEISKRFEGRNDMVSNNTKNELLKRLSEAQEYLKSQKQSQQSEQINQMAGGGNLEEGQQMGNNFVDMAAMGSDMIMPGSGQLLKIGDQLGQTVGTSIGGDKGESIGGLLNPVGTIKGIGTALKTGNLNDIPGIGIFGGATSAQKERIKQANNLAITTNRRTSDNYLSLGGVVDGPNDKKLVSKDTLLNTKILPATNVAVQPGRFRYAIGEQSGVQHGTNGEQGHYLYYGKKPGDSGFDPNIHREFVNENGYITYMNSPQGQQYRRNLVVNKQQPIEQFEFAMGGNINQYNGGGDMDSLDPLNINYYENLKLTPRNTAPIESVNQLKPVDATVNYKNVIASLPINQAVTKGPSTVDFAKYYSKKAGETISNNSDLLRYAPAVMNAYQLAKLKKPTGVRLDRLDNRYKPEYVDLAQQQNIVNQELNNTNSAIQQSGASEGASRAAMLGAQLNKTRALSNAYMNAQAQNAQQNATAQQFNLGVDQTNLQQSNLQQDINDRNMGNYDTQKSKLQSQIGTDLGNIGKEELFKKYPERMGLMYDAKGNPVSGAKQDKDGIWRDKDGNELFPANKKKNGGYLNSDVVSHINNMYIKRNNK